MRSSIVAALGIVLITSVGTGSGAQALVVDFAAVAIGGNVGADTQDLAFASVLGLGNSAITVSNVGGDDTSGLAVGDIITVSPPTIAGIGGVSATLSPPLVISWTDSLGAFSESFVDFNVSRQVTSLTLFGGGTLTGPGASGGAGLQIIANRNSSANAIAVFLTDNGKASAPLTAPAIPEPSTWAMMLLGFAGLGYLGHKASRGTGLAAA